jgi:hypothetical protein
MNSYWVEHHARLHVEELVADARGDRLVAEADVWGASTPDRGTGSHPRPLLVVRDWMVARASRSRGRFASAK